MEDWKRDWFSTAAGRAELGHGHRPQSEYRSLLPAQCHRQRIDRAALGAGLRQDRATAVTVPKPDSVAYSNPVAYADSNDTEPIADDANTRCECYSG